MINKEDYVNAINNRTTKILNLLGIAKRARKLISGYDTVINGLSNKKVCLVLVASNASDLTKEKFVNKCDYYNIFIDCSFSGEQLSKSIGKENVVVLAIIDLGIANSLEKLIKEGVKNEG